MKILIVADVLGPKNNGTSMAAYNLIEALQKRGHEVRVLCGDIDKVNEPGYYICPKMNFGLFNKYLDKNDVHPAKADRYVINRAMDGVDHIHIMLPFSVGNAVAKLANKKHIPMTAGFHMQAENLTSHFHVQRLKPLNRPVYRYIYRSMYRYVDAIHFPTKFIKDDFEKAVGPTNGYVISNGVRSTFKKMKVERDEKLKDTFNILYTGRYSREKRQDLLIRAAKKSKYSDRIRLILAGDGPMRKSIEKKCKTLLHRPILGMHSQKELIEIINSCDLYVHCAYAELESIACLEAIACGLVPVINNTKRVATKHFAISDRNLFKANSVRSLVKQIDYWIEHPEEKELMSKKYEEFTKQFEFEHCMDRMEKMMIEAKQVRDYKTKHHLINRVITFKDPMNEDFACTDIHSKKLDGSFVYVHKSKTWRLTAKILNLIARPMVWLILKFMRKVRVDNRKELKKIKKTGSFLYLSHTSKYDAVVPQTMISRRKNTYIVANRDAVSIKGLKNFVMMLGALPVPNSIETTIKFREAIEERIKEKGVVAIYPEAHIWPFSSYVRPFPDVSFTYPAKLNVPIIAVGTYYIPRKKPRPLTSKPKMRLVLSEPIYPDPDRSVAENAKYLRDQAYDFMNKVAKEHPMSDFLNYIPCVEGSTKFEK